MAGTSTTFPSIEIGAKSKKGKDPFENQVYLRLYPVTMKWWARMDRSMGDGGNVDNIPVYRDRREKQEGKGSVRKPGLSSPRPGHDEVVGPHGSFDGRWRERRQHSRLSRSARKARRERIRSKTRSIFASTRSR